MRKTIDLIPLRLDNDESPSDILRQASSFVIINYNSQTKFVVMGGGEGGKCCSNLVKRNKNYCIHLRSE